MLVEILSVDVHGLHGIVCRFFLTVLIEDHREYERLGGNPDSIHGGYAIPQFPLTDRPISGEPSITGP